MKKIIGTILLGVPLFLAPSVQAEGPVRFGFEIGWPGCCGKAKWGCCGLQTGCCGCGLAPWYTYWPYAAHFSAPAHPQFPYWPPPMKSSLSVHPPAAQAPVYTTVGYYPTPPTYWYGR
ncbi:MAG: hypothetical protein KatS3mg105_2051 [Gemmatales bacterium]|nr:MAG: hypothetical protein KatS3mg105_2051 [Gemmatales bacterium]